MGGLGRHGAHLGAQRRAALHRERGAPGEGQVLLRPSSKVVVKFLQVMMKNGYIGEFELVDTRCGRKIVVQLNGRVNKCGVISPRYDISPSEVEDWVGRLLPSRQ